MKPIMPTSVIYLLVVFSNFALIHLLKLQFALAILELLLIVGLLARQRLAWTLGTLWMGLGALGFSFQALIMVIQGFDQLEAGDLGYFLFLVVEAGIFLSAWMILRRPQAMIYFELYCPRCGAAPRYQPGFLFRNTKQCPQCGLRWSSYKQDYLSKIANQEQSEELGD